MTAPSKMVLRLLLLCILIGGFNKSSFANITESGGTGGTNICNTNVVGGSTASFTTLNVITITEGLAADFGNNFGAWNATITIAAPTGWQFNTAVSPTYLVTSAPTNITTVTQTGITTGLITIHIVGNGNNRVDAFTITGLQVQATSVAAAAGTLTGAVTLGTATGFAGDNFANLSLTTPPAAIGANTQMCTSGSTITLTNSVAGGTWSGGAAGIATVTVGSASGLTTPGATQGTTTITYSNGCGTAASITATVNAAPAAIAGNTQMCASSSAITLTNTSTNGTWSGGTAGIATVTVGGTSGLTTPGATQGTTTISYSNGCGLATSVTATVNAAPAAIGNNTQMCTGGTTITLTNTSTNGAWSGGTPGIATVNAASGVVTPGATQGTTTISYSNGCGIATSVTATVNASPAVIGGNAQMCTSSSTITLTNTSTNGVWIGGTAGVATVDPVLGVVTPGATQGTTTIQYSNGCGSPASVTATVNASPAAIGGNAPLCTGGATITLTNTSTNGAWSGGTVGVATVNPASGLVTSGATTGNTSMSYTNGCGSAQTVTVTVGGANAGTISGATGVCIGSSIPLSDAVAGGGWSSSVPSVATVDFLGNVYGAGPGSTVISYSVTNSCGTAIATYTVSASSPANAGSIGGIANMCAGTFTVLTETASGGVWTASNADATVTPTGLLTAITPGVDVITYTVTNPCGAAATTFTVNIGAFLDAGTISGTSSVCPGFNIQLSDNVSGGVWSSSNTNIATISGLGLVTGESAGAATISYLIIAACGSAAATYNVTVDPLPAPGVITGPSVICQGTFALLSDAATGGVWSSSNTNIATVDNTGLAYGNGVGGATILYTVTTACGSSSAPFAMTIAPAPNAGTISGFSAVCVGSNITLTDNVAGGVWSSGNANANVSGSGVVTGVSSGPGLISYTSTTACASLSSTYSFTINPLPAPGTISGSSAAVCTGTVLSLTDAATGGVWSSTIPASATVDASGNVTGVNSGSTTISYTVTNICGTAAATQVVTVNQSPVVAGIAGSSDVCVSSVVVLSDATSGGLWSSSNTNVSIVSGASGLIVTGAGAGTAIISYAVTNGFGCTTTVTTSENINALPVVAAISGPAFGCVGSVTALSDATPGGVWSSGNSLVATIDPATGMLSGVAIGALNISYTVTTISGCTTTVAMIDNISAIPAVTVTTGNTSICAGNVTTLSNATTGGVWSSSDNTTATVDAAGNVTGVAGGTDYVVYTVSNVCGAALDSALVTVNPLPVIFPITAANTTICAGNTVSLNESATGGVWSSSDTTIAAVDTSGNVTGIAAGLTAIHYIITSSFGCVSESSLLISVGPAMPALTLTPSGTATLCHGNPVMLDLTSSGGILTYQWVTGATPIPGATDSTYIADLAGTYSVIISNGVCSETFGSTTLIVAPDPVVSFLAPDVLFTGGYTTYQWFLNGVALVGDTASLIHETGSGAYTVVVSNGTGCTDTSAIYTVIATGVNTVTAAQDVKIYPNPATAVLNIDAPGKVNVSVLSVDGKEVISQKDATSIDVRDLASGMYIIMIYDENNNFIKSAKFAKTQQ